MALAVSFYKDFGYSTHHPQLTTLISLFIEKPFECWNFRMSALLGVLIVPFFVLFCFVTEVPHKCVSTGSANGSYVNPLYYVSLARMEKRGWNQFFLPRHTAKLSITPSLFGMPLQNFIWEHKIYNCTCKSICRISHQIG